jgi:chromosome partitioning protein
MRVIAVANQKGGCGKTTTAINLSSFLALKKYKTLLIDFDPQAHGTMGLGIKPSELERTIYDAIRPLRDPGVRLEHVIVPVKENLDLAPSSTRLSAIEQELAGADGRESRLSSALKDLNRPYDYVVIDSPPSIGHLSFNALRAAEEVIIPIDLSLFSLRGVSKLMEIILLLKEKLDHEVRARALITMFDHRTRYSRLVMEKVREEFGENVFKTVIRYNIRLREAVDYGVPIGEYDRHSIGHQDYAQLADEVIAQAERRGESADAAQALLQKAEAYIDTVEPASALEDETMDSGMHERVAIYSTDSIYSLEEEAERY